MDRIRITHAIVARLETLGISPAAVLRQARLPHTLLEQERVFVSTAQWFAMWQALESFVADPAFGLKLSSATQGEPYDPLAITALSTSSFHGALIKMARYKRLFSAEDIRITNHGNEWAIEVEWLAANNPPPLLIDASLAHVMNVGQQGTGRKLRAERVVFRREEKHRSVYEAHFGCPINWGAGGDVLILSHETIMHPFSTANPGLLALLEPQLEAALRERETQDGFVEEVKLLLRNQLAAKPPTAHDVARDLHMSARTLQRRLAEGGVQFQQLLEQVRHELAKDYLRASSLELNEIAFLLGYQEASSFHRAFHTWEGRTPGQWRTTQREANANS